MVAFQTMQHLCWLIHSPMHAECVHLLFLWEKYEAAAAFSPSLAVWNQDGWVWRFASFQGFIKKNIYIFLTLLSFDGIEFMKKKE